MYNSRGQLRAWKKIEASKKALIAHQYFSNQLAAQKALLKSTHLKYYDIQGDIQNIFATWDRAPYNSPTYHASLFADMAVGEDISQRSGQRIYIHSVKVHIELEEVATTSVSLPERTYQHSIRYALVKDSQCNGYTPDGTDPWTHDGIEAMQQIDDGRRWTILKDKTYQPILNGKNLRYSGTAWESPKNHILHKFEWKPQKPLLVHFTGTTTGITGVVDNNIFLTVIADEAEFSSVTWTRVCFTDA